MDSRFVELLARKDEVVIPLPEWMLSSAAREALKQEKHPLIVEIAGPDSVAAAILASQQVEATAVLPTVAYTGTEHGDPESLIRARNILATRLSPDVTVYPMVFLGAPRFWWVLCGRFMSLLLARLGGFSPCLGCHLYLHALRVPLAREFSCPVVAGERENHDGVVKLNQTAPALESYLRLYEVFGAELLLPLRFVGSGQEIRRLVGSPLDDNGDQLHCVLSSNYRLPDATLAMGHEGVRDYFNLFALPIAERVVHGYLSGEPVDPLEAAAAVAKNLWLLDVERPGCDCPSGWTR